MPILKSVLILIFAALFLKPQEPTDLQIDKSIDKEISAVKDLPRNAQEHAIADLAIRIAQRPARNVVVLATNLAGAANEVSPLKRETLQTIATTLQNALRTSPQEKSDDAYPALAKMARYDHVQVTLDDPGYTAAIASMLADEQRTGKLDFTLFDPHKRKWNLKSLRGKVVLVNFWAAWSAPCGRQLPEFAALYARFHRRGLVILLITEEDPSALKLPYPVLLDPNRKVHERFGVQAIPRTFIYNRQGRLVTQSNDAPTVEGFFDMLSQAGLH